MTSFLRNTLSKLISKLDGLQCVWWHCNIGSKRAFPTGVLERWHNCLLMYWRTTCLVPAFGDTKCHVPSTEWCQRYVRVTYFQFPIQSAFLRYIARQAAPALQRTVGFNTQYRTSDVAENLGRYLFVRSVWYRKKTELLLMVKMETRGTIGPFGSEFPAICNHFGVMTDWTRKTWKCCCNFCVYVRKEIPYGKIFKILFRKFSPPHR